MAEEYSSNNDTEKTEEPTQYRIDEFRKRGDVASSRELTSALVLAASLLSLILSFTYMYETLAQFINWLYTLDHSKAFEQKKFFEIVEKSVSTMLLCAAPIYIITFCVSIISNVIQVGFLYAPEVLTIKWERINPILGIKKLFTIRSALEALKGVLKFLFIFSIVYFFMKEEITKLNGYLHLDYIQGMHHGKNVIVKIIFFILIGLFLIAVFDFSYQKISYYNKLKMTKEEIKRERKEQEGNPEIKQRIKNIQKEMSQKRMIQDVPKADVIIANPTHISIALKYEAKTMSSPKVIAKGIDFIALKIRDVARDHDIPIVENISLARNLYKIVKLGSFIPRDLYKAVAEVLSFVYKIKKRKIDNERIS